MAKNLDPVEIDVIAPVAVDSAPDHLGTAPGPAPDASADTTPAIAGRGTGDRAPH